MERAVFRGICGEIFALFQVFVGNFDTIPDLGGHEVESISLCVQSSRRAKKVLVIGMYRPPGLLKVTWEHDINNILLRSTQRYESILLIGDLNCDLSRPDKGVKEGKTLMDLMDVYGLTNLIKVPTRVLVESSSLTDVTLTNKPRSLLTSGVFDLGLSDHNLIYTVMRLQCPKFSPRTVVRPTSIIMTQDCFHLTLLQFPSVLHIFLMTVRMCVGHGENCYPTPWTYMLQSRDPYPSVNMCHS